MSPLPPRRPEAAPPLTVLVVDDERLFLRSLEWCLAEAGHRVLLASSADAALELLERQPALDILLTDVCLDGAHGQSVARRAQERFPALAVLFMSALGRDQLLAERRIPADAVVVEKPFTPDELIRKVIEVAPRAARCISGADGAPA